MCVTSASATLESTIVGAWEIEHPSYGYRHVMAYQNTPKNLADTPICCCTCRQQSLYCLNRGYGVPEHLHPFLPTVIDVEHLDDEAPNDDGWWGLL